MIRGTSVSLIVTHIDALNYFTSSSSSSKIDYYLPSNLDWDIIL